MDGLAFYDGEDKGQRPASCWKGFDLAQTIKSVLIFTVKSRKIGITLELSSQS